MPTKLLAKNAGQVNIERMAVQAFHAHDVKRPTR